MFLVLASYCEPMHSLEASGLELYDASCDWRGAFEIGRWRVDFGT